MSSPTLCGAIATFFANDDTLKTLMTCGPKASPWLNEVPENKPPPFVCFFHEGEDPEWTFEQPTVMTATLGQPVSYQERTKIRFEIYAQTAQATEAIQLAIKLAFPYNAALDITDCDFVEAIRGQYRLLPAGQYRAPNTEIVFPGHIDYTFTINRHA